MVLLVALLVFAVSCLCCCGGISAGLFLVADRVQTAVREMPKSIPVPGVTVTPDVNDWITARTLAPVYTTALDAVTSDKNVIERLGEPIETVGDSTDLFRLKGSDDPDNPGETIEFDIKGPRGPAKVTVGTSRPSAALPGVATTDELRVAKITVTLSDGSVIDVPPPKEQPAFVPIR
jgi:cytochrome oxidase complex assembly protein 1